MAWAEWPALSGEQGLFGFEQYWPELARRSWPLTCRERALEPPLAVALQLSGVASVAAGPEAPFLQTD